MSGPAREQYAFDFNQIQRGKLLAIIVVKQWTTP